MTGIALFSPRITPAHRYEWQLDLLDIDAYLNRIGYRGPLEPTAEVLRAIHRAHALTIPFENLDIPLGYGVSLVLEHIQAKLVRQKRGGYCYEHNLLLAAVLDAIGFDVRRLVARVRPDDDGPRSHMMLNVHLDGRDWLADVGFGAALIEPIPLTERAPARQGSWIYDVARGGNDEWILREWTNGEVANLYAFTHDHQRPADYAAYNHRTSTDPASPFTGQIVAIRTTPGVKYTLRGRELTAKRPDGLPDQRTIANDELDETLRHTFGIELDPGEIARLQAAS